MKEYWVVGGEYADTRFERAIEGTFENHGPFADYETARRRWQERTMSTVDNAMMRFRVIDRQAAVAA